MAPGAPRPASRALPGVTVRRSVFGPVGRDASGIGRSRGAEARRGLSRGRHGVDGGTPSAVLNAANGRTS
jgi:hypothetical protein